MHSNPGLRPGLFWDGPMALHAHPGSNLGVREDASGGMGEYGSAIKIGEVRRACPVSPNGAAQIS